MSKKKSFIWKKCSKHRNCNRWKSSFCVLYKYILHKYRFVLNGWYIFDIKWKWFKSKLYIIGGKSNKRIIHIYLVTLKWWNLEKKTCQELWINGREKPLLAFLLVFMLVILIVDKCTHINLFHILKDIKHKFLLIYFIIFQQAIIVFFYFPYFL